MRANRAMGTASTFRLRDIALPCALACGAAGCDDGAKTPALSRTADVVRSAPIPAENAPKLGVVSELVQVREFTDPRAPSLGVLRAGTRVPRSAQPVSRCVRARRCRATWRPYSAPAPWRPRWGG